MVIKIGTRLREIMFLNERLVDLYLDLPRDSLREVSKNMGMSYTHALKMLKIWVSMGLVTDRKVGMKYNIFYTDKGLKIALELRRMRKIMKMSKIQWINVSGVV